MFRFGFLFTFIPKYDKCYSRLFLHVWRRYDHKSYSISDRPVSGGHRLPSFMTSLNSSNCFYCTWSLSGMYSISLLSLHCMYKKNWLKGEDMNIVSTWTVLRRWRCRAVRSCRKTIRLSSSSTTRRPHAPVPYCCFVVFRPTVAPFFLNRPAAAEYCRRSPAADGRRSSAADRGDCLDRGSTGRTSTRRSRQPPGRRAALTRASCLRRHKTRWPWRPARQRYRTKLQILLLVTCLPWWLPECRKLSRKDDVNSTCGQNDEQ